MSILHQNATLHRSNIPATCEVIGWTVLNIIKMQTDAQRFLPLLERKICSAPPSEASNIRCWFIPKLRSSKNGIRTSPRDFHGMIIVSENITVSRYTVLNNQNRNFFWLNKCLEACVYSNFINQKQSSKFHHWLYISLTTYIHH